MSTTVAAIHPLGHEDRFGAHDCRRRSSYIVCGQVILPADDELSSDADNMEVYALSSYYSDGPRTYLRR